ncbi:hypothetical protein [Sulfurimonas sp.]|uniref:hypothetical protein n=1 Tax=Sulfurimonas sp. TaxID=2022749 RepID=UPI0025D9D8D4|nr:hypothetical protein [Sulfurimonas sp.]
MIGDFKAALILELDKDELNAETYFGELADPKNFKVNLKASPLILVDYVGDKPVNPLKKEHKFNLYITHISYSKNKKTRISKHNEIYDLLKDIDKKVALKSFVGSEPIVVGKSEKIYDSVVSAGYLTVFTKEISVVLDN